MFIENCHTTHFSVPPLLILGQSAWPHSARHITSGKISSWSCDTDLPTALCHLLMNLFYSRGVKQPTFPLCLPPAPAVPDVYWKSSVPPGCVGASDSQSPPPAALPPAVGSSCCCSLKLSGVAGFLYPDPDNSPERQKPGEFENL